MVSLLIPLLGRVAAKAGDALVAELLRAWGLDKFRRKLERHLAAVQCILLDADAKSRTNPAVRRWVQDLKTVAYQADDILDGFHYEVLRRRAAHSTACKMMSYFTVNSPVVFRLSMSRKMKDALEIIDDLVMEMHKFQFLQHAETPSVDHPQTHSHVDESEIVGREDEKEQVVKILLDHSHDNIDNNNITVLPIVGMGGIGKTTLAQLVHNDQRVVHHFELVLWVCVSDKFVIKEIIQSIIQVATMNMCGLTKMEALQKKLAEVLVNKRCLLVLDDVWNEDRNKWGDMRSLLNSHAGLGSAIIVTTRSDKVASIMGTLPSHQISLLNEYDSWELFQRNTFGREVKQQWELISMAKNIVPNCKGLPLAIKSISTLLCSKHHSEWFSVLDSNVWKSDILTTGIVPALQLSYDHLSSEEKICFAFCAIFPKDTLMDKGTLIQLWMANDFIASETRGQQIFDVLVWRCFLQDVKIKENEFIYRPTTCKMHDLMHDLADSVSGSDCYIFTDSSWHQAIRDGLIDLSSLQHEVRHLSLYYASYITIPRMEKILVPQPRTILDQRKLKFSDETYMLPCKSVNIAMSKFVSLRALKTFSTEANMTSMKHLRYLDCSYSDITALPEAITMLYSLQTLKLIGCEYLHKLPEGMRYMSSLRHIFLVGCNSLKRMPRDISQLNSLQTLTNYVIDSDAGRGIDQLKYLNLGDALSLTEVRKVHSAENAEQGNLSAKHNLKRLSLDWYGPFSTSDGDEVDTNAEVILEALRPHRSLEGLRLSNYSGAKFSSWMHNSTLLEQLGELFLSGCKNCKDLPPLWQLPSLMYLGLIGLDSLTSICVGNDDRENGGSCISPPPFFPKLEYMEVNSMPKLERWHQEAAVVSFPRLKELVIYTCPRLETLPEGLLQQLPAVEELHLTNCPKLCGAFGRGGAYWDLVEAIPKRCVWQTDMLVENA
ncbi:putative disease resistance protein RGA3 [Hordeum vulgare subsp. vulgare]|uniref:Uncharacterized protein n=1 Tax=Hordeum vulgare subsp. vulgare TaxID=112509 RepID=A0A8I6Z5F8_HORVV|nr:putative disease resistance protein RGA3 [Hordeum vulgare subsp. vulgare]